MLKILVCILLTLVSIGGAAQQESYTLGPESMPQPGVPKGIIKQDTIKSHLYNNYREYFIYVPVQYDSSQGAAFMVFQDGHAYLQEDGHFRVPTVFDNLIHSREMPVTIGIFVNPGHHTFEFPENRFRASNRSDEYDELSDRYVRFLIEELIPKVKRQYVLLEDRKMHAITGLSSGGIAAFTAAWERPDYFHKVVSHIGSFTNIRGGDAYPSLVRRGAKRDIKVFLQDGSNDLDLVFGNWWLSNLQMEAALKFKGYDFKFVGGTGGHTGKHGGSIFPETMKWLWSDVSE